MNKTLLTLVVLAAALCLSGCGVATYYGPYPHHPPVVYGPPGPVIEVVPVPGPPPGPPPGPYPYPRHWHHPRPCPW